MQRILQARHVSHLVTVFCFSFLILSAGISLAGEAIIYPPNGIKTINNTADSLGPTGSDTGKSNSLDDNHITLTYSAIGGMIVGAINLNDSDAVTKNQVIVDNGTVGAAVRGGWSSLGAATDNSVIVTGSSVVGGNIYGATGSIDASNNRVTVEAGSSVHGDGYGGEGSGSANYNSMVIRGTVGTASGGGYIHGGYGPREANNNSVWVDGGTVVRGVFGGTSPGGGAMGNAVTLTNAQVGGFVFGGSSTSSGEVSNNSVTIESGSYLQYGATGGGSINGNATGNSATMKGGTVAWYVRGGYSDTADATGNRVIVEGGTIGDGDYGGVYGGYSDGGVASGNTVSMTDGMVNGNILGGRSTDGHTTDNHVAFAGGSVSGNIFGGRGTGDATGNTVTIAGGTVGGNVYGGEGVTATDNQLVITGGTVGGDIYGGSSAGGNATNNTVSISGAPDLSAAIIYGGYALDSEDPDEFNDSGDIFSGNTFNIASANVAVSGIKNFQTYNFYLPGTTANGDTVMHVSDEADISGSTINVGVEGGSSPLQAGDKVTLIDAATLTGTPVNGTSDGQGMQGVTLRYDFIIETADNLLTARLAAVEVNERTKALSEGFISSLVLTRQSADLIAEEGIQEAISAAEREYGIGLGTFGTISGNWARYDTGSHVDVSGMSLMAGLSWAGDFTPGRLTLAAFFEYGTGSYDTYNSFSNAADVHGDGKTYHIGGGVLGHMEFNPTDTGRFYAEGSLRAGGLHNEYDSHDLRDIEGRVASYDYSSSYYGLHAGIGYIWNLAENISLDTYGKYFWTHQKGESITLSTGEPIDFDNANSHRLRVGGRLAWTLHEQVTPYIGAAYEYEFDGEVNAATNGYVLDSPTLRGATGMGELGLRLQPAASLPLFFNLGVQGYLGTREGVTGSLNARLYF